MLKGYVRTRIPRGEKRFLTSDSFTKFSKENGFRPMTVSRNSSMKKDFDLWQFHEILQGKRISTYDSFTKFSKEKGFWPMAVSRKFPRKNKGRRKQPRTLLKKAKWTKPKNTFYVWVLSSAPVLFPNFCLWIFYFLWLFVRGVKLLYWREVLGSLHFALKKSFGFLRWLVKGSFGSLGDRNFQHW